MYCFGIYHRSSAIDRLDAALLIAFQEISRITDRQTVAPLACERHKLRVECVDTDMSCPNVPTQLAFDKASLSTGFERLLGIGHARSPLFDWVVR